METFPKSARLCGRDRIGQLFREGARAACGTIAVRALPNADGGTRVATVAGKTLGNAAMRSRLRRRLRAAYRTQRESLPTGFDLVLIARPGLAEESWLELRRTMAKAVERVTRSDGRPRSRQEA